MCFKESNVRSHLLIIQCVFDDHNSKGNCVHRKLITLGLLLTVLQLFTSVGQKKNTECTYLSTIWLLVVSRECSSGCKKISHISAIYGDVPMKVQG